MTKKILYCTACGTELVFTTVPTGHFNNENGKPTYYVDVECPLYHKPSLRDRLFRWDRIHTNYRWYDMWLERNVESDEYDLAKEGLKSDRVSMRRWG